MPIGRSVTGARGSFGISLRRARGRMHPARHDPVAPDDARHHRASGEYGKKREIKQVTRKLCVDRGVPPSTNSPISTSRSIASRAPTRRCARAWQARTISSMERAFWLAARGKESPTDPRQRAPDVALEDDDQDDESRRSRSDRAENPGSRARTGRSAARSGPGRAGPVSSVRPACPESA